MDKLKTRPASRAPLALVAALTLALGACAATQPTGPSVAALAGPRVSDRQFVRDDSACRARAQGATNQAAAAQTSASLQGQYDSVYSDCMLTRGYEVSEGAPRFAPDPGVRLYGPGPYADGPMTYYGWGFSAGF
ncbi:hypothetical protein [Rhodoblastus sp.]|uniref:hypothetical protein n=1 Tax=Rhodoblastus sp. TaxID=1962975 RepID=UPI0035B31AB6